MRAVIQRVLEAKVSVGGAAIGEIGPGLLVFLGVEGEDSEADAEWLCRKIAQVRVFPDDEGRMNRSVADVKGGVLLISQFTLFGSLKKGTRPSFNRAAPPEKAVPLYERSVELLEKELGKRPATGEFAADMKIHALNDGPVTLILDSKNKKL